LLIFEFLSLLKFDLVEATILSLQYATPIWLHAQCSADVIIIIYILIVIIIFFVQWHKA